MRIFALAILLSGCAGWDRIEAQAWKKDGACSVVCDYHQGYMSTSYTLSRTSCRCYTPQLADFNQGRLIKLDNPEAVLRCVPDCKTAAKTILNRQPWRRQRQEDFE